MTEHLHDNLAMLYEAFSREEIDEIYTGEHFEVQGVEFVCKYSPGSTARRFFIVKPLEFAKRCIELYRQFERANIVELGIAEGGSTALLALVAKPRKLVAFDLAPQPLAALAELLEERGLADAVHPYYGVDQADHARLAGIVDREVDGEPLDLVIDDASHQFAPTRSSFETLFPRLRPGGVFVIEDWNADHTFRDAVVAKLREASSSDREERTQRIRETQASKGAPEQRRDPTLSRLAVELLLTRACTGDAIEEVTLSEFCILVRRGSAALDPDSFRLDDHYRDYFGYLPSP